MAQTSPVRLLTVRPHEMATGTRTAKAGDQLLDSFPRRSGLSLKYVPEDYSVYVPPQCVGARRCPLFVYLINQGEQWRLVADHYGMILLFLPNGNLAPDDSISKLIDAALKQTLRRFAIDPDKIAIGGTCSTGGQAFFWGRSNLHVFSRVIEISPVNHFTVTTPPQNKKAEFYLVAGVDEQTGSEHNNRDNYYLSNSMQSARELRRDGLRDERRVKAVLDLRTHEGRAVDYDLIARWLHDSWATSNPAARPAPVVVTDSQPVLTNEALARVTDFWGRFMREPDSVRIKARLAHLRQIFVPIGTTRRMVWMSDLPALAAKYPSVAADLRAAGLTARQAEDYRIALISARATWSAGSEAGTVAASSVLGRNVAFFDAHTTDLQALEATQMWRTR